MTYSTLLLEQDADGILVVTINRPDKLNALNATVIRELAAVAVIVRDDATVRAVIVTGAGPKAFVAGADITEIAAIEGDDGIEFAERGQSAFRALETAGKPVIAAINGFALGGGCELAMACHIRIATSNARFGQPEVKLGVVPGYGGTVRLPRLVGRGRAVELLLTGAMIDADEAYRIGLVNRVVAPEALMDEARTMARTILQMGPVAVRHALESVDAGMDVSIDTALAMEAQHFGATCDTHDRVEGTRAFVEKRAAQFRGA